MAKFTSSDKLKELHKISDKNKDKRDALNKAAGEAWNKGLQRLDLEIPHSLLVKIKKLAKKAKMSPSQAASILLTEGVKKEREREERLSAMGTHLRRDTVIPQ